jgi:hypothetical protein
MHINQININILIIDTCHEIAILNITASISTRIQHNKLSLCGVFLNLFLKENGHNTNLRHRDVLVMPSSKINTGTHGVLRRQCSPKQTHLAIGFSRSKIWDVDGRREAWLGGRLRSCTATFGRLNNGKQRDKGKRNR